MICYLQEDDPPANHAPEKFGVVCGNCYSALADLEREARLEIARLREDLLRCQREYRKQSKELNKAEFKTAQLVSFARDVAANYDCDKDAHRYRTPCRKCEAAAALLEAGK